MSKRDFTVTIGSISLANDRVEFFLCLGGMRVPNTSVFRTVMPGESLVLAAAKALAEMLGWFA